MTASPIPDEYKVHAVHTPVKTPARPLTPPPKDMTLTEIEDTPTKNNTHINSILTKRDGKDEDKALTGPLCMPELPGRPGEHNFTEEMLFKRLEQIAQSPGTEEARPLIFSQPSPGLATPEAGEGEIEGGPADIHSNSGGIAAPVPTQELSTEIPTQPASLMSPQSGLSLSQVTSNEEIEAAVQRDFDQGGIKLKKKGSCNFGAPFGSLGGFGTVRRAS